MNLSENWFAANGWIVAIGIFAIVGLVKSLSRNQVRMTEVIHGSQRSSQEVDALRSEIVELRRLVTQHSLQIDDVTQRARALQQDSGSRVEEVGR